MTQLELQASNNDPSITFSTGAQQTMRTCSILDVYIDLDLPSIDMVQFFFVPGGSNQLSEGNSRIIRTSQTGRQTLAIRIISPTGFEDHFRLDPATQPVAITLYNLQLRCRF